ncbi:MAG: response regulator [Verrucomicrobia bacterium]|nr:response regulator [Verrucomicrobiota bacterium]
MKRSILIVDDEATLAEAVADHFAAQGFDASTASTAEEALELVRLRPFDVAVTDLKMPGMSGLELLRAVRGVPRAPAVILMSAYGTMDVVVEALRLGVADFLHKPVVLEALTRSVEQALERRAPSRGKTETAVPLHALRECTRRVGPVSVEVVGDPASPQATAVWHIRALDRTRTAFVWGHVDAGARFAGIARLLIRALAGAVDLAIPAAAVARIADELKALDCACGVHGLTGGVIETGSARRLVGATLGASGIVRLAPAKAGYDIFVEGHSGCVRTFEAQLADSDVLLLAEPRVVKAGAERWADVLAETNRLLVDGESKPARRALAMLNNVADGTPVMVALRMQAIVVTNGMAHVRVAADRAGLARAREATEQFVLDTPLSDEAAHGLVTAVQEALLNCIRWAYPGREGPVYLTLSREEDHVRASVRDRGIGFDVSEAYNRETEKTRDPLRRSGRGLRLMHGSADRFEIVSRLGRGTNVVVEKHFDVSKPEHEEVPRSA